MSSHITLPVPFKPTTLRLFLPRSIPSTAISMAPLLSLLAVLYTRQIKGRAFLVIGVSRGGRTTKIHALVNVLGRPLRLALTPGNTSDIKGADLLVGATAGMKRVIADRGYDASHVRLKLRDQGTTPVIPGRRNRKRPIQYDERRYPRPMAPRPCSFASGTYAGSPPAMTNSRAITSPPSHSPPSSPSGHERVWALTEPADWQFRRLR